MRRPGDLTLIHLLFVLTLPAALARPALAQGNRDSLRAGSTAYDRADFAAAARLLPFGLDPAAGPQDADWVTGVHKLADALLQTGDSASIGLWLAWAHRVAPAFPIDTLLFPPRVQRVILAARAEFRPAAMDSLVETTWQFGQGGDAASRRGALRLGDAPGFTLGVLENVGTILPEERRTLAAGTYTVTLRVEGAAPIRVTREVLPGVTTVVTPRPRAAAAAVATPAARADSAAAIEARLSAGGAASCLVTSATSWCWGSNAGGLLGGGWTDSARAPVMVSGSERLTAITVGSGHACGLTAAGRAFCWGAGSAGQLGNGGTTASPAPVAVSGTQTFTATAAGAQHTCAVARTGAVFCWGAGTSGQLGNRSNATSAVPVGVNTPAGASMSAIVAGGSHNCAITTRGVAWCWGTGSSGELGNGSNRDANTPVQVSGDYAFRALAAGIAHTCGILTNGRVLCWGANGSGQLGTGAAQPSTRPVAISDTTAFASLSAGDQFTCGITAAGATWCWGAGGAGQLGNGGTADSRRPSLVVGGLNIRTLASGAAHVCAMTTDGIVWCWGSNDAGQLGVLAGRTSPTALPVLARPAPRPAPIGLQPRREIRDNFDDGNLTAGVVWERDSLPGARIRVDSGELVIGRAQTRGAVGAVGVTLPVRIAARDAVLRFDVRVVSNATPGGCGLNCAAWPATVRVRVKNRDFTESEVWYVYGARPGTRGWSASGITIVPGAAPVGAWARGQRIAIQDAASRADSIIEISFGGIGTEFETRFDNIIVPAPVIASVALRPDTARLTRGGDTLRLAAEPRDAGGTAQPWAGVTWSSSDTSVARVSATGLVTAVGNGTAQIRATAEEASAVARVTVRIAPTRPVRRRRP